MNYIIELYILYYFLWVDQRFAFVSPILRSSISVVFCFSSHFHLNNFWAGFYLAILIQPISKSNYVINKIHF